MVIRKACDKNDKKLETFNEFQNWIGKAISEYPDH